VNSKQPEAVGRNHHYKRGAVGSSDHAPAWVELKQAGGGRSSPRERGPAVDSRLLLAPSLYRGAGPTSGTLLEIELG
jgi:hypothetical protein